MKKFCCTAALAACVALGGFGQESFARGEELFMQNRPADAIIYLEQAVASDPAHVMASLYLGIAYEQMDKTDEAILVYRQILGQAGNLTATIANNLGNAYFKKGSAEEAEATYTHAIEADQSFAPAYLGRANTRINRQAQAEAILDYEHYLRLDPRSTQREPIERLIALIRAEAIEAERQRQIAEELARAEAERRQRLLDEVTASLQAAAGASRGISAGAENVEGYEGEFELE